MSVSARFAGHTRGKKTVAYSNNGRVKQAILGINFSYEDVSKNVFVNNIVYRTFPNSVNYEVYHI